jgi:hypothetical protein
MPLRRKSTKFIRNSSLSARRHGRKKLMHRQTSLTGASIRSISQGENRMPETGHDNTDQHATDVVQLLERIRSLEEQTRKELVAKLMEGVFYAPAKRVAVAGAMKSASEEIEPDLVAEAVRNTGTLEGKKSAASEAVKSAKDGEENKVIAAAVRNAKTLESRRVAAAEAIRSDKNGEEEVIAEAVKSIETIEGKKIAAAEAVRSTPQLSEKAKIVSATQKEATGVRKMVGHMIIWSFIVIGIVAVLAIGMGLLGRSSNAQPLIIICTAVASTLAGYIVGASSMIGGSPRNLAREGTRMEEETQRQE